MTIYGLKCTQIGYNISICRKTFLNNLRFHAKHVYSIDENLTFDLISKIKELGFSEFVLSKKDNAHLK